MRLTLLVCRRICKSHEEATGAFKVQCDMLLAWEVSNSVIVHGWSLLFKTLMSPYVIPEYWKNARPFVRFRILHVTISELQSTVALWQHISMELGRAHMI